MNLYFAQRGKVALRRYLYPLMTRIPRFTRLILTTALVLLVTMTILRLCLFIFFNRQGNSLADCFPSLALGARYDCRYIAIILLIPLLLCNSRYFDVFRTTRGRRFWFSWLSVLVGILILFYALDFAYYDYLTQRLNAGVLNFLQDAAISAKMVWQTYPVLRLLLGIVVVSWFIVWILKRVYKRILATKPAENRSSRIIWPVACFLLMALAIFGRVGQYPLRWSDAFTLGNDYKANLALNPAEAFFNTLSFRHSSFDLAAVKEGYPLLSRSLPLPYSSSELNFRRAVDAPKNSSKQIPNIVLVICESFSAYKSSMWGNPLNTTPYFKSMCDSGIFFSRCFTPSYGTARGVWATLTGIPDVQVPTTASRNPLIVDQHTIMNDFVNSEKYYFIGGSTSWANIRGVLSSNISNLHLYEQQNYDAATVDVWGVSDKNLFLQANKILAKEDKPFFAIIQTADNHRPYTIPKEDEAEFKRKDFPKEELNKYGFESNDEMNAFRYTDFCYQKFIEAAKNEKYFDNTIFVFVGDHGIAGEAGDMFPRPWTDMRLDNMHVPLLFYSPKLLSPLRGDMICSQIDVMPTIAGLAHIDYTNTTLGRDLLDSSFSNDPSRHFAFLFDVDMKSIGLANNQYFFRRSLNGSREDFVSILNNDPVVPSPHTDSIKSNMKSLTLAMYNASQYLLFNNKKK
ncbi:MAG: hypothetical protein C5B52_07215 [Bacteroidetes bacterium]|nr:MAG: hypothetical protein C5B52_07215 [Bacteroidota bacterium]